MQFGFKLITRALIVEVCLRVSATLCRLGRDHTEKKGGAEFYLCDGGDPEHGLSPGLSG